MSYKIVAVCNCPIGVAHTYMAAEALMKICETAGHQIKIETQGAFGTECELSEVDIEEADFVVLALGTSLSPQTMNKFKGKRIIRQQINEVLRNPQKVLDEMDQMAQSPRQKRRKSAEIIKTYLFNHLMAGMSYMIPLAVAAGMLVALASIGIIGMPVEGTYRYVLYKTGLLGLELMLPVLSVGIAYSIGDKSAIAPALIGGYLLIEYEILGVHYSSGLLGAIAVGFVAGYLIKSIGLLKVSFYFKPIMRYVGIPLIGTLGVVTSIYYVIAPIVSSIMGEMTKLLGELSERNTLLVCIVIGIMLVVDMGGPINKAAYLFAIGMAGEGYRLYFGIVGLVIVLPAAALGVATLLAPELFNEEEKQNGKAAFLLGMMGITEPAILYAVNDPLPVMGAQIIAAIITSVLGFGYSVERIAPGINFLDPLLGNTTPVVPYFVILGIGITINSILVIIFKKIRGWQHV